MNKQAPSASRIVTMLVFGLSCIGLLVFLWVSFGGSVPLAPQGYRLSVEFDQAVQLATEADVRIAGVDVGKVVSKGLDRATGLTRAVLQIDSRFAPRPADTRAILRSKTLLGETYVQLTPGSRTAAAIPDGAALPQGQVAPTVQLDQILSTFDPATRRAFQVWQQQYGVALTGRGEAFNAALAELYPFATNVESVLAVLRRDGAATSTLLRDGGQVFSALSSSPAQLQGFIRNSNAVFAATAAQDVALASTIRAFPPFLIATRTTIDRLNRFAGNTKPLIDELRPAALQLSPALQAMVGLAPELRNLFVDIAPLTAASRSGVPALEHFLDATVPLLTRLKPYLGNFVPVINYIQSYRRELAGFFANSSASTEATLQSAFGTNVHYVRISSPVNPELLSTYQGRLSSNRANPYLVPGGFDRLLSGLPVFASDLCTNHPQPTIGNTIPTTKTPSGLTLRQVLEEIYYTSKPGGPPCQAQPPLGTATTGQPQEFPHLQPLP